MSISQSFPEKDLFTCIKSFSLKVRLLISHTSRGWLQDDWENESVCRDHLHNLFLLHLGVGLVSPWKDHETMSGALAFMAAAKARHHLILWLWWPVGFLFASHTVPQLTEKQLLTNYFPRAQWGRVRNTPLPEFPWRRYFCIVERLLFEGPASSSLQKVLRSSPLGHW